MVTLDRLVNVLGSYGIRLRFCSVPRSTELSSVVMHEAAADRAVVGDVLLAVGARSVKEAVRWAVAAKAVAMPPCAPGWTAQGDLAQAGERLGVHENTVRYRLRRMAEVTTLSLDSARKRFAMMIELASIDDVSEANKY